MSEVEDAAKEAIETRDGGLNSLVAALVAVTATLMAVGNIKDGNVVQAMTQAQARAVDTWSFYQAKSTKQHIAENSGEAIRLRLETEESLSAAARAHLAAAASRYETASRRYAAEKEELRAKAEGLEKEYERLNVRDDQFDMAEACLTVAIAMYGISALTRKRWLFLFGFGLTLAGLAFTISGFAGFSLHPDWLAKLLG